MAGKDVYKAYAGALFDIGVQNNILDRIVEDFKIFIQFFSSNNDLALFLNSHLISKDKKKTLIDKLFLEELCPDIVLFLKVLIDHNRQSSIVDIYSHLIEITDEENNTKRIKIITAVKLSPEIIGEIESLISAKLDKNIILIEELDDSIIGGFKIMIDDTIIDGSIARYLANIRAKLIEREVGSGIAYED